MRLVSLILSLTLKIRVELKAGRGRTARAPITICLKDKWQIWATYCTLVEIMIWHFGLDAVPVSQMCEECVLFVSCVSAGVFPIFAAVSTLQST